MERYNEIFNIAVEYVKSKMEKKNIIAKKNENNKTYILLKKLI